MQEGPLEERPYEEVDLFDYIEVLVKRRWLIIFGTAVCVLSTLVYSLTAEKKYKAEASILPSEERDYLAQLLVGQAGGQPAPRTSVYIDILKSVPVMKAVLEKEYTYHLDGEEARGTLMEYFRAGTVHQGIRALEDISKFSQARNTGIITISVTTKSPELSAAVANEFVNQLQIYNTQRRRTRAKEQMEFIEKRLKEVKKELAEAERNLADFKRKNRNLIAMGGSSGEGSISFSFPELAMELERLQREVKLKSDLFETLTKQYELARIEAKKETPVIEVLNWAEPPDRPAGKGKKFLLLLSFVTGGFVSVGMAFFLEYVEKAHRSGRTRTVVEELRKDKERIRRMFGGKGGGSSG